MKQEVFDDIYNSVTADFLKQLPSELDSLKKGLRSADPASAYAEIASFTFRASLKVQKKLLQALLVDE